MLTDVVVDCLVDPNESIVSSQDEIEYVKEGGDWDIKDRAKWEDAMGAMVPFL